MKGGGFIKSVEIVCVFVCEVYV